MYELAHALYYQRIRTCCFCTRTKKGLQYDSLDVSTNIRLETNDYLRLLHDGNMKYTRIIFAADENSLHIDSNFAGRDFHLSIIQNKLSEILKGVPQSVIIQPQCCENIVSISAKRGSSIGVTLSIACIMTLKFSISEEERMEILKNKSYTLFFVTKYNDISLQIEKMNGFLWIRFQYTPLDVCVTSRVSFERVYRALMRLK